MAELGFTVIDTSLTVETVSGVDCVMPTQQPEAAGRMHRLGNRRLILGQDRHQCRET